MKQTKQARIEELEAELVELNAANIRLHMRVAQLEAPAPAEPPYWREPCYWETPPGTVHDRARFSTTPSQMPPWSIDVIC